MLFGLIAAFLTVSLPPPDPAIEEPSSLTAYRETFARQQSAEATDDIVVRVDRAEEMDQAIRHAMMSLWFHRNDPAYEPLSEILQKEMLAQDLERTELIRPLVEDGSWLDAEAYDDEFRSNVWIIAQHSPDRALMAEVLQQIEPLALAGRFNRQEYAMMYDRVAMFEGRPQRYGTQMQCVEGRYDPGPLEDPENINARRAAIGFAVVRIEDAIANSNRFPCEEM